MPVHWPLLDALPEPDRRALISQAWPPRFARQEVIFHEETPAMRSTSSNGGTSRFVSTRRWATWRPCWVVCAGEF